MEPEQTSTAPRHALWLTALVLGGFAAYWPLLDTFFWGIDDWKHLEHAQLFASGHPIAAFQARIFDYHGSQAGLRQTSTVLWGLDYLLFGTNARAYLATNLAVHLTVGGLCYTVVWRFGRSAFAAAMAAAVFVFNAETAEVVWFIATRSEALALLFAAVCVLAWTGAEERPWLRWAAAGALLLALFAKTTAAYVPLILVAWDTGTLPRSQWLEKRRLLAAYGPIAVVLALYAVALALFVGIGDAASYVPEARVSLMEKLRIFAQAGGQALLTPTWPPYPHSSGRAADSGAIVRAVSIGVLLVGAAATRKMPRPLLLLGVGWLLAGFVLIWPLVTGGMVFGRYFLPSSFGLAILVGGAIVALDRPGLRTLGGAAGVAAVVGSLVGLVEPAALQLRTEIGDEVRDAILELRSGAAAQPDATTLTIIVPVPASGLVELLSRPKALALLVPEASWDSVRLLGEGTRDLMEVAGGDGCRDFEVIDDNFRLADLAAGGASQVLYVPGFLPGGGTERATPRFGSLAPSASPRPPDASTVSSAGAAAPAPLDRNTPEVGGWAFSLPGRASTVVPTEPLTVTWEGFALDYEFILESPPVSFPPSSMCELRVELVPAPTDASSSWVRCVLEPETWALLLWSESTMHRGPYEHAMVLPLEAAGRPEQLSIDLANSPSWLQTPRIRRFAIAPMNRRGTVRVDRIELVPCAPGSP